MSPEQVTPRRDTSALVAAAGSGDPDHAGCLALLEDDEGPLITSPLVIAGRVHARPPARAHAEAALYTAILDGTLTVGPLTHPDWERIRELVTTYADLGLDGTDASLGALAERRVLTRIATLDHRHFRVVRPRHVEAFELLP